MITLSVFPASSRVQKQNTSAPAFPLPGPKHLALVLIDFEIFCMTTWDQTASFLAGRCLRPVGPHRLFGFMYPSAQLQARVSRRGFHRSPPNERYWCVPSDRGTDLPLTRHVTPSGGSPWGNVCWLWSSLVLSLRVQAFCNYRLCSCRRDVFHRKRFSASAATVVTISLLGMFHPNTKK